MNRIFCWWTFLYIITFLIFRGKLAILHDFFFINWLELNCRSKIANSIYWKILYAKGTSLFLPNFFQIEQIAQKQEKRARTRTYTIKNSATGSWLPFWSQGFFVAVDIPCTDEPRIKLDVGDIVKVTRWKRYTIFLLYIFTFTVYFFWSTRKTKNFTQNHFNFPP